MTDSVCVKKFRQQKFGLNISMNAYFYRPFISSENKIVIIKTVFFFNFQI